MSLVPKSPSRKLREVAFYCRGRLRGKGNSAGGYARSLFTAEVGYAVPMRNSSPTRRRLRFAVHLASPKTLDFEGSKCQHWHEIKPLGDSESGCWNDNSNR